VPLVAAPISLIVEARFRRVLFRVQFGQIDHCYRSVITILLHAHFFSVPLASAIDAGSSAALV
jgi:hypothetical protein